MNHRLRTVPSIARRATYLTLFCFTISLAYAWNYAIAAPSQAELLVQSSSDAQHKSVKSLSPSLLEGSASEGSSPFLASDLYVTIKQPTGQIINYSVDSFGNLHGDHGKTIVLRPIARSKLLNEARQLRAKHYGELLSWQEAKRVIPRKTNLTVIDLETGLRFNAQRRAGSSHADVQPLTKADTETMKQIYNGTWSWHRRAILVEANGRTLAASMHGMPHGGDGIPGNGFSGHFCIHFQGSTTHGKGNIDLGHQLMIAKASGTLGSFMSELDPYDTINTFFLANTYDDRALMHRVFPISMLPQAKRRYFGAEDAAIRHRFMEPDEHSHTELITDIPVETCQARGSRCAQKSVSIFHMRRLSLLDAWTIDDITTPRQ
ncbi:hypothetical protein [Paenibacillus paeoniae]|uniref:Uncharacterized protein n=1 Tax=Paenibacillus paeoniae TaxID=2292705 RepID=A0A371PEF0_9BACL|nr:hypothetical protein [Paenibacillus paeoniae]REK74287.1 hypothetical protein DX130_17270 [Paenibacillus paeoniae]